ncbi:hypothetical protein TDB9533_04674 [Thalassocella blandensis]|nr:hypothetical protein TDB9533_04674 [Thalassocella blandensis]
MSKPDSMISTDNVLMDLRLVILRAIADVWEDEASGLPSTLLQDLYRELDGNSNLNMFPNIDVKGLLEKHLDLENHLQTPEKRSLRDYLTKAPFWLLRMYFRYRYDYHIPFSNFSVYFIEGSAIWNKFGDDSWTKPENETITITLPMCEDEWGEYQKTARLMEYYTYFPNLFGSTQHEPPNFNTQENLSFQRNNSHTNMKGNDYNLGVSEDTFLSFGAVVSKMIAVAWNNDLFRKTIDYDARLEAYTTELNTTNNEGVLNNHEFQEFERQYFTEMDHILKTHYEFDFPWAFNIKFVFAEKFQHQADNELPESNEATLFTNRRNTSRLSFWTKDTNDKNINDNETNHWRWRWKDNQNGLYLIRNSVSLEIPLTPSSKHENVSLALARYNAIGPAYPFTCS